MLKLKLQLWPPQAKSWLIGKDPDAGTDWGPEEEGTTEDEMAGWHHWLDGHEFGWTVGVGDGQWGLVCCDSWCSKESDTTEWLNWIECSRRGFDAWVRKPPWKRKWKPTPVFLPGKSHEQRSLEGYSPWGHKTVRHDLATKQQQQSFKIILIYFTWVSMSSKHGNQKSPDTSRPMTPETPSGTVSLLSRHARGWTETLGGVRSKGNCPVTLCQFLLCPRRGKSQNNQRRSSLEDGS